VGRTTLGTVPPRPRRLRSLLRPPCHWLGKIGLDAAQQPGNLTLSQPQLRRQLHTRCGSPEIVEGFLCRFRLGLGFPDLVVDG